MLTLPMYVPVQKHLFIISEQNSTYVPIACIFERFEWAKDVPSFLALPSRCQSFTIRIIAGMLLSQQLRAENGHYLLVSYELYFSNEAQDVTHDFLPSKRLKTSTSHTCSPP